MRTLAHYTIFGNEIYHLHIFDFLEDGTVSHFPANEETADTLFVEGLLIVATGDIAKQYRQITAATAEIHSGRPLREAAEAIAAVLPSYAAGSPLTLWQAVFPDFRLVPLRNRF